MKKLIIIPVLVFLLAFAVSATDAPQLKTGLVAFYNMNESSGAPIDYGTYKYNMSISGGSGSVTYSGNLTSGYDFTEYYIFSAPDGSDWDLDTGDLTMCIALDMDKSGGHNDPLPIGKDNGGDGVYWYSPGSGTNDQLQFITRESSTGSTNQLYVPDSEAYLYLCGIRDGGQQSACFLNSTQWSCSGNVSSTRNVTNDANLLLDCFYSGETGLCMEGIIGRVGVWARALDTTDLELLADNADASTWAYAPFDEGSAPLPPSWVDPTPADATTNNTQVNLNASCEEDINHYIWFGNSTNQSLVLENATIGNWTTNVTEQTTYTYVAGCFNATSNLFSANSSTRTWTYDFTFPTITLEDANEFDTNNESKNNQFDDTFIWNLTFTDNVDLFGYQLNITKGGTIYFNETNETMSGTSVNYYNSIDISSWEAGVYDIRVTVSDSHTDDEIPEYEESHKKSKLQFKTPTDNNIKIESRDSSDVGSLKLKDRYEFSFTFDDGLSTDRTFDVKTDKCPLRYKQDSGYKGHLVSYCPGSYDGNWIDFEGAEGTPIVNKVDDYHYTVYFSNLPPTITFESLGGLNIYDANFTWYRGTYSYNNATGVVNEAYNFIFNLTNNSALITDISVGFVYNSTGRGVQEAQYSGYNQYNSTLTLPDYENLFNFTWNVNITQGANNYSFQVNGSQLVSDFLIDDCSVATDQTFTLYYFDEIEPSTTLTATLEAYLIYSPYADFINMKNESFDLAGGINHTFCISPNDIPLYVDAYFVYNVTNGFTHRYYFRNVTLNTTWQSFNLYNVDNQTGFSVLKLTERNSNTYQYYQNVITSLQRFYTGEGIWRTVQMDESGEYGLVNFDIIERTTEYRMIFVDRNTTRTLKITEPMKFICTAGLCDLTYLLSPESDVSQADIIYNLTYDNATMTFDFDWSDSGGATRTTRFYLWKTTITGVTDICDTTQTGAGGSISCNASAYTGVAYLYIWQDGELISGDTYELGTTRIGNFLPSVEGGFWAVVIMIVCVMFGMFSPVGSIISGIAGLIIIYLMGIFTPLTLAGVIIATIIGVIIGLKVRA